MDPDPPSRAIVSVGAEIDVAKLDEEIRAEIVRKDHEGLYPPELVQGLAEDTVRDRMDALRGAAELSVDPPTDSARRLLGPVAAQFKRAIAKGLRWHTRWQVGQMLTFGGSAVAVLAAMEDRLDEVERRLHHLSEQVSHLQAAHLAGLQAAGGAVRGPGVAWDAALNDAARLRELTARPKRSRVLCLGCGEGDFLEAVVGSGAHCYGVEPDADLASRGRERGLDVRSEGMLDHLSAIAEASLGAIVVEAGERLGPATIEDLFRLAVAVLVRDGLLIVDVAVPAGFESAARSESGSRIPYGFLAESVGFRSVRVEGPPSGEGRLCPVMPPGEPTLAGLVAAINGNLRLLDEAVYGPRRLRVVAKR